jgi:hypothetical protein
MSLAITIERLKIYQRYKGDGDAITRVGKRNDKESFGADIGGLWTIIASKIQDVELIKTGLVSKGLKSQIINDLKEVCDKDSFEELTRGLSL